MSERVAIVSGAGSGIGAAVVEVLSKRGFRVVLLGRTLSKLESVIGRLKDAPKDHLWAEQVDLKDTAALQPLVEKIQAKWHRIDVLVNNAGLALGSPLRFHEQKLQDIIEVMNTNVISTMALTHAVLNSAMMKAGPRSCGAGTIINVSSVTGLEAPANGEAAYHTSKAALEAFSNVLRIETSGTNIRVLVVRPGFVGGTTAFHQNRLKDDPKASADEVFEGIEPLTEKDVADAIAYQIDAPERLSVKAIDLVPTAQRSLAITDREWLSRKAT